MVNMMNSFRSHRSSLIYLHFAGWIIYILGDYADHVFGYGVYYALPSVGSGVAACALTGLVAVIADFSRNMRMFIRVPIFLFTLFATSLVWHKIWGALHVDAADKTLGAFRRIADLSFGQWFETGYVPLLLFLTWAGFYTGSKMYFSRLEKLEELHRAKLEAKKAQLHTLRYQLNPHFLFNCLNSIDVSVQSDDKNTAHQMIQHLTSFLRRSLEQGEQDKISFGEEMALIEDFVAIEKLRFGEGVKLTLDVPSNCKEVMVPPMLLQPLMENALKYAWNQSSQGHVELVAVKDLSFLKITIINSKLQNETLGTGTGLRNTRERLKLLYQEDAKLEVFDLLDQYRVELTLPWEVSFR